MQPRWRSWAQSLLGLASPAPLEVCYEYSPRLRRLVARRLADETYDLVYVKRLRMAQYAALAARVPRVLDLTDAMTRFYAQGAQRAPWPSRALFYEEWLKHRLYEPRVAGGFARCLVASPVDAEFLRRSEGLRNVVVVPNPVDTQYFHPRPEAEQPATFLLSGLMDKLVNVDAAQYLCDEIWPRVRAELPTARLRLVGPRPNQVVRGLQDRPGVEVAGFVPDLRDELSAATTVLVPLRLGTGTKNKVLQALAMGRPVVTTSIGNEGLGATSGVHLEVADDAIRFAEAMVRLQRDPARRARLGAAGRSWVSEHYSLATVMQHLEQTLWKVVGQACR
jgi:glycosyltransferase involved in cell wall biosynthesis